MKRTKKITMLILLTMLLTGVFGTTAFAKSSTVATIGSKQYTSLEAAVKKVKKGQTIVLKKNVTYSKTLTISSSAKKFTINLNGKTIKFKKKTNYLYIKKGTVTLTNGTIKQSAAEGYSLKVKKGAALNIKKGTYTGRISNAGTMTVTKGTFATAYTKTDVSQAFVTNTGKLTIKGGTFNGKKTVTIKNAGTLKISGGTFKYTGYANKEYLDCIDGGDYGTLLDNVKKGTATITGGSFTSSALCFRNGSNASLTVKGGTFKTTQDGNTKSEGTLRITGGTWTSGGLLVTERGGGTITVTGGTFKCPWIVFETGSDDSLVKITGGTFTSTAGEDGVMLLCSAGKMNVTGGTFVGKNTNLYHGNVIIGSKVKKNVKGLEKEDF